MSSVRPSPGFSSPSDADDTGIKLKELERALKPLMSRLNGVEAMASLDAQTEIAKEKVKAWAYDAEDVLDEWRFEQLRAAVEPPPSPTMDPSFCRRFDELDQRRLEIGESYRILRQARAQDRGRHGTNEERHVTSSFLSEPDIYGREDDKGMLVDFLLTGAMEESWNVVPLVGAADVGKSTLLKHIYHDSNVRHHFNLWCFASASGGLQMMELMKKVGKRLTKEPCDYDQSVAVEDLLQKTINGRRLLLVLDNVSYETVDGDHWDKLRAAFSGCADGSVIILATHDERVAGKTGTVPYYFLESLSGDPCWSVFQKHAFGSLPTDARLVEIGKKIAKECQGSPLLARALGIRLRHERDAEKWEEFLQTGIWDEVVQVLKPRYQNLSAHLKRCFAYCSMFPRGYLFNREELVRLWIAQGFVEEKTEKVLEDTGLKYFDDLVTRSYFQKSELDAGTFVMPNAPHALAQSVSDGRCVTIEDSNLSTFTRNDLRKLHHLSMTPSNGELATQFLSDTTHLRSFLVVPTWPLKKISHLSLSDEALLSLSRLRVLDVSHTDIEDLPGTMGELKHLRYLNLSGTKVRRIPASAFRLYNLQTLDLSCTAIQVLPDAIGKLINLLHLRLHATKLRKLPESIGRLSKLLTLHLGVTKIEELPETIGRLRCVRFLCLDVSKIQRLPASMRELSELQTLELHGVKDEESYNHVTLLNRDSEEHLNERNDQPVLYQDVSDMPDSNIKYLTSRSANHSDDKGSSSNDAAKAEDQRFLMWMGDPSLSKLTYVVLKNCIMCKTLPQLDQLPLLVELHIDGMPVEHVGQDFCRHGDKHGFRSLEKLSFQNMYEWQKWDGVDEGDFPCLHELILFNCPKLKGVPCFHSSLTKLKVERCAVSSIPTKESLQELELCACDNLVTLSELSSLSDLRDLTLMYCQNLACFPLAPLLEKLWVEECEQLLPDSLPHSWSSMIHNCR